MIKGGVVQSGAVVAGDLTSWKAASVIQDSGVTAASAIAALASAAQTKGQTGVPMVSSGSGSMANNGVGTLTTALGATPAITSCYILLPAGAVATGVPAAATYYYAVFTDTTHYTAFNNTYSTGTTSIPGTPTAFVTTGPGAYAGVSGATGAYNLSIPGNTLGINGGLNVTVAFAYTNSAANKVLAVSFGTMALLSETVTTTLSASSMVGFKNAGATGLQIATTTSTGSTFGSSGANLPSAAIDTTAAQTVTVTMTNATPASNNLILAAASVQFVPGVT